MKSELETAFTKKNETYLKLSSTHKDFYGWNSDIKCDGLLFNSLWSIGGVSVDVELAKSASGKWYRHPSFNCYDLGQSASDISRDMFIGLCLWILKNKRGDVISDLILYGERNNWIMGRGDISRTYVSPSLQATFYDIRHHLTGKGNWKRNIMRDWYKPIPISIPQTVKGYARHIQVLHILINCIMRNPSSREIELLDFHRKDQPENALIEAIYCKLAKKPFDDAIALLMDTNKFPNDSLPTTENYDSDYLYSRDMNSLDWKPSTGQKREWPAIEWLFTASIIRGQI
jgi:hypothetical protein